MAESQKIPISSVRPGAKPEVSEGAGEFRALARRLMNEFGAPVGLLDARRGSWVLRAGAPSEVFPGFDPGLLSATAAGRRPQLWRGEEPHGPVWLLVPARSGSGPLVAAVGFASTPGATADTPRWGPVCPDSALQAWGQSVADRLREEAGDRDPDPNPSTVSHADPAHPRPPHEAGERQIIARLIRRLRISDPPERFQQLATNAIRTAMGVRAVAWVPCHHSEPVVASGEIGRLAGDGYRTLLPGPHVKETVLLDNEPRPPAAPELRRMIAVSADSLGSTGWLIAMNPLDGRPFTHGDGEHVQPVASLISTQQINARVYGDLKELLFGVIRALTAAIDAKDPYTSGHSERVARIAVRLGEELGMTPNQRGDLYLMGLLHDVGKIGVDDAVLKKPGPLTPDEYRQIQLHVEIGVHILADLKKLNHLLPGVRHHHESLDGSGYPAALAGEAIPFEARILAVADSYDAMSSTRPYRRRLTPMQIDEILRKGAGTQWDARIVQALFACRMDLEMIRQKGLGESLQLAVSETLGRA